MDDFCEQHSCYFDTDDGCAACSKSIVCDLDILREVANVEAAKDALYLELEDTTNPDTRSDLLRQLEDLSRWDSRSANLLAGVRF